MKLNLAECSIKGQKEMPLEDIRDFTYITQSCLLQEITSVTSLISWFFIFHLFILLAFFFHFQYIQYYTKWPRLQAMDIDFVHSKVSADQLDRRQSGYRVCSSIPIHQSNWNKLLYQQEGECFDYWHKCPTQVWWHPWVCYVFFLTHVQSMVSEQEFA